MGSTAFIDMQEMLPFHISHLSFTGLIEHYFVIAYLLALYIYYFQISCLHIIPRGQAM